MRLSSRRRSRGIHTTELFEIGKSLEAVESLLPLATLSVITKLEYDPEGVVVGLLQQFLWQ